MAEAPSTAAAGNNRGSVERDRAGSVSNSGRIRAGSVSNNARGRFGSISNGPDGGSRGIVGRVRGASVSLINANPQLGMWQASGLAIAQAPNLNELRDPESGAGHIEFSPQGYSMRTAVEESDGELTLAKSKTRVNTLEVPPTVHEDEIPRDEIKEDEAHPPRHPHLHHLHERGHQMLHRRQTLKDKHTSERKEPWTKTVGHGLRAFWKWFRTPAGFLITIYFLNIVAWGGMLFLLELHAAPAMDHPDNGNADSSPRKIWLEIDSQILNALFCVTGFGLAPWRFRDLYWFIKARHFKNRFAMEKLYLQNKAWFRPPAWATNEPDGTASDAFINSGETQATGTKNEGTVVTAHRIDMPQTFTGDRAPPTAWWKLAFVIWMMVMNTLLQAVLSFFMWHYNRINRPGWATGTFIALGCGVAMFAGLMSWWEGRKVKKIEGPAIKVVEKV